MAWDVGKLCGSLPQLPRVAAQGTRGSTRRLRDHTKQFGCTEGRLLGSLGFCYSQQRDVSRMIPCRNPAEAYLLLFLPSL